MRKGTGKMCFISVTRQMFCPRLNLLQPARCSEEKPAHGQSKSGQMAECRRAGSQRRVFTQKTQHDN